MACSTDRGNLLIAEGKDALIQLQKLVDAHSSETKPVQTDVAKAERMLLTSDCYEPVSDEEMRLVVEAMAKEFKGTGH